jgi:hypothetical protein
MDRADGLISERELRTLVWADYLVVICQICAHKFPQTNYTTTTQQMANAKAKLAQAKAAEEAARAAKAQAEAELKQAEELNEED